MMLSNLQEKDFKVLRGPFESARQKPDSLGLILLLGAFLQGLLFYLTYFVAGYNTGFPFLNQLMIVHLGATALIIVMSIIYGIPYIYRRHQIMQYVVVILTTTNILGGLFYLCSVFIMWPDSILEKDEPTLITGLIISFLIGVMTFIVTWFRFMYLLKKGAYRSGTKREKLRKKFETKSLLVPAIVIGTGISISLQAFFRTMTTNGNDVLIIIVGLLLFYAMAFILPEQIILVYCKRRFKSFNFDQKGDLYPLGSGDLHSL